MTGDAEGTSYVVPIYRFIILQKYIEQTKTTEIVIKKPKLLFDFQKLIQDKLRKILIKNQSLLQMIK